MSTTSFCNSNHILVGLGGTGGKILRAFKMRMFEEFHDDEERKKQPVALLYVDSTDEMMPQDGKARPDFRVMGKDASFTRNEFLNIKAVDVEHILDHIGNYPSVKGIVSNVTAVKSAIGSLGQAAGQKRRAGRLLFAANAVGYVNSLRDAYARCEKISGDASNTNIHIFAGLCGGTGSGSIIDVIIQSRKAFPDAKISVYAEMKKSLWSEDYDGCYEYWRFRTSAQDYDETVGDVSRIKEIQPTGNGWYVVTYLDMGNEGRTEVKVSDGKIVDLKTDKSWEGWDE